MYQPVTLKTLALVGDPIPLPADFIGLTDAVLADFSASMSPPPVGYDGKGLWPLIVSDPTFDITTEIITGEIDLSSRNTNKSTCTVTATYIKRALTADEISALNPVPVSVSSAQACAILDEDGLLDRVEAIVAKMPRVVQIWFERANSWERNSPYVAGVGLELDLSDADLDDKFKRAAKRL